MFPSHVLLRLPNPRPARCETHFICKNSPKIVREWQGYEGDGGLGGRGGSCPCPHYQSSVVSLPLRGVGDGGTRLGFSVYLPPPLILIRVWSWLGQGKRGEGGQASVFHPSGYEPFTLVSNFGRKGSVLRSPRWEDSLGGGGCPGGCWCVQGPEAEAEAEAVALAAPRGRL